MHEAAAATSRAWKGRAVPTCNDREANPRHKVKEVFDVFPWFSVNSLDTAIYEIHI